MGPTKHRKNLWIVVIVVIKLIEVASGDYDPVCIFEDKKNSQSMLSYSEEGVKEGSLITYCSRDELDKQESLMQSPVDTNISSTALAVMKSKRSRCPFPLKIVREYNLTKAEGKIWKNGHDKLFTIAEGDEQKENMLEEEMFWFYSLYGFYVQAKKSSNKTKFTKGDPVEQVHKTQFSFYGSIRIINGQLFNFFQLYKSIENTNRNIHFYRYEIPLSNMKRYTPKLSNIVEYVRNNYEVYLEDTCYGVQMKDVFDRERQFTTLGEFLNNIKDEVKQNTIKEHKIQYSFFKMSHLVPTIHLLFDGYKTMRGNCTVVAVWESIYEYLLEVDLAISHYATALSKKVCISAGYSGILSNNNDYPFHLHNNNSESGIIVPALIWKRVIAFKDDKVSYPDSFVVTITNNIFQNMDQVFSPFKTVKQICSDSCTEVELNIQAPSITIPVLKSNTPEMQIQEKDEEEIEINTNNREVGEGKSNLLEKMGHGIIRCCWINDEKWKRFEKANYLNFIPKL